MNAFANFFYKFPQNLKTIFWGNNLIFQLLAILLTWLIVKSDLDWKYYVAFHGIPGGYLIPAMAIGGLLPMVLPFILWGLGAIKKNLSIMLAGYALGQAALLGWLVSSFYKAFTGRVPPPWHGQIAADVSQQFHFGFWRGGIFWGWPSSHTTVAFAMAVALIALFPKNRAVKILALTYALYIGLAVSVSIHWLSEFLAGIIFGSIIGLAVGQNFFKRHEQSLR